MVYSSFCWRIIKLNNLIYDISEKPRTIKEWVLCFDIVIPAASVGICSMFFIVGFISINGPNTESLDIYIMS